MHQASKHICLGWIYQESFIFFLNNYAWLDIVSLHNNATEDFNTLIKKTLHVY